MSELEALMQDDLESAPVSDLKRLQELCDLFAKQEDAVKEAEKALKAAKAEFDKTRLDDLPELMIELGMSKLVTESGDEISLREEVSAAITKANKGAALSWLTDNNYGGLIKTKVVVEFDKDAREKAVETAKELILRELAVSLDEAVHPATLKSFVKERLAEGDEIPMDLFSVHPYNVATIQRGKAK